MTTVILARNYTKEDPMQGDGPIATPGDHRELPPLSKTVLIGAVAVKILLHVPGLFRYGYFRDELYFLDCARHLDRSANLSESLAGRCDRTVTVHRVLLRVIAS